MDEFEIGKASYVMILVWTSIAWQVFVIGAVGLIFEDAWKVIAIVVALWGFVSYAYQHYLDDRRTSETVDPNASEAPKESVPLGRA
ncbi:PREDICTED: probable purine permease [Prunus dulcis]|uniref:PREDICTED: probable purine permease n=1 Tax=Prunus dulcis TaxID=3755 RepID=A0A5E4FYC2_PRUDU|nr:hypothetical protein L3X38_026916 [Prunus dulcis]VVA32497.1 PREDICTED: probable purine permease [Prunus dulcis]